MSIPPISLERFTTLYRIEHDWLFDRLLRILGSDRNLVLAADQNCGIQGYARELGFQLTETQTDMHVCYLDMKPAQTSTSFMELFAEAFSSRFPEVTSRMDIDSSNMDVFSLPKLIAHKKKIRIAVFMANFHLIHRFRNQDSFLRILRMRLKNQKNVAFCLYGINNQLLRDLIDHPGPLSGIGQYIHLKHDKSEHRSASIRKIFHDHDKNIGSSTSFHMSQLVDNHPFYLKLLVWHALIRTKYTCTSSIVDYAMSDLIHHFDKHFHDIMDNLTPKQISFMKAMMEGNDKPYSKNTRESYQLGSTGNIWGIRISLQKKGIIKDIMDTGDRKMVFTDPIFMEWLRKCYFADEIVFR